MAGRNRQDGDRAESDDKDERQHQLRAEIEALVGGQRRGLEEMRRRQQEFREKLARRRTRRPRKSRRKDGGH